MLTNARAVPQRFAALDAGVRTPPTSFRIWAFGPVKTVKGTFLFDRKAASSVMAEWRDWGNRLTFDYGHDATLGARGEDGKSAGSCNLELRSDGLYAVDVRWTPQAAAQLAAGEWLYFSPTFSHEKAGRIRALVNIALTNIPATKGMTPLVAASKKDRAMTIEEALKLFRSAERRLVSCNAAIVALEGDGDGDTEEMKKAKTAKREAMKAKLAKAKLEYESALRECEALGEDPTDGADDDEEEDADEPPPPKSRPGKTETSRRSAPKRSVTGLSAADATRIAQKVLEVTGASTAAEAVGKLGALSQIAEDTGSEVVERMQALEDRVFKREAKALMDEATAAGKLTPKARAYASKITELEELIAYLDTLPVVAATRTNGRSATPHVESPEDVSRMTVAQLSADELALCERLGNSPEDFLAQKKANAERRSASQASRPVRLVK
jgi:phage I-like protein